MTCGGCGGPGSLAAGSFHWDDCPWVTKDHPDHRFISRSRPPKISLKEDVYATRGSHGGAQCHFCTVRPVYLWFHAYFVVPYEAGGDGAVVQGTIPCCRDCASSTSFPALQAQLDADAQVPP